MTTLQGPRESPGLVLVVGLFMIFALQGVAVWSAVVHPAVGAAVGVTELVLAWRMTSTPRTRVLRWLLAIFGVATILLAVYYAVVQPV